MKLKKISSRIFFTLLCLGLFFMACSNPAANNSMENDEKQSSGNTSQSTKKGKVRFEFTEKGNRLLSQLALVDGHSELSRSQSIENALLVELTIEESNYGIPMIEKERLFVYRMGNSITTDSIELTSGSYRITRFLVINDKREYIFAAPVTGSRYEKWVSDPLPIPFTVSRQTTTNIAIDVLDTGDSEMEDFGYKGIDINPISTFSFYMGIYGNTNNSGKAELTEGEVSVTSVSGNGEGEVTKTNSFPARICGQKVVETGTEYRVKISKNGYTDTTLTLSKKMLTKFTKDNPLKILLTKGTGSETIVLEQTMNSHEIEIARLDPRTGTVTKLFTASCDSSSRSPVPIVKGQKIYIQYPGYRHHHPQLDQSTDIAVYDLKSGNEERRISILDQDLTDDSYRIFGVNDEKTLFGVSYFKNATSTYTASLHTIDMQTGDICQFASYTIPVDSMYGSVDQIKAVMHSNTIIMSIIYYNSGTKLDVLQIDSRTGHIEKRATFPGGNSSSYAKVLAIDLTGRWFGYTNDEYGNFYESGQFKEIFTLNELGYSNAAVYCQGNRMYLTDSNFDGLKVYQIPSLNLLYYPETSSSGGYNVVGVGSVDN